MRLKNENETIGFSGTILSIQYKKIESDKYGELPTYYSRVELESFTDCNGDEIEKDTYLAELKVLETKIGRRSRKHKFNMTLYIDEDTFETEDLHEGDILKFNKVKINTDNFKLKVYDSEKLKDYPKAKLKKDEHGRTYANMKITSVKFSCPLGEWKRKFKFDELYYISIDRVKFFQTSKADMQFEDTFGKFLNKSEYNKLLALNNEIVDIGCYAKKIKFDSFKAKITLSYEQEIDKYYCKIEKVEDD